MLTDSDIDAIFEKMDGLVLSLVRDPSTAGPTYFQEIIAECRNYLNEASLVVAKLNREKYLITMDLRAREDVFSLDYDDLLANDERVKSLASVEDRKATANYLLRDQKKEINTLKNRLHAVEAVLKVAVHRNRELNSTMTAIKDQRKLLQTELAAGAFYGDERVPKSKRDPREPDDGFGLTGISEEALDSLFDEEDSESTPNVGSEKLEVKNEKTDVDPPVEKKTLDPEEKEIEAFLGSDTPDSTVDPQPVVGDKKETELDDMSDLLSQLEGL